MPSPIEHDLYDGRLSDQIVASFIPGSGSEAGNRPLVRWRVTDEAERARRDGRLHFDWPSGVDVAGLVRRDLTESHRVYTRQGNCRIGTTGRLVRGTVQAAPEKGSRQRNGSHGKDAERNQPWPTRPGRFEQQQFILHAKTL